MDIEKLLREIRIVVCTVLVGVLCARVATLPDFSHTTDALNSSVNKRGIVLDKASVLEDSAHKFGHQVSMDYFDPDNPQDGFYRNMKDDFVNSSRASNNFNETILATNKNLNGPNGVFSNVNTLLVSVTTTVNSLSDDLNKLTTSTSDVLVPLKASLGNVDTLTKELSEELSKGGDIAQTVVKLNQGLDNVNILLSDPNVALTIANGQKASASLASSAETLNIVTLPYRKKVSQIKLALDKLFGVFKVTVKAW